MNMRCAIGLGLFLVFAHVVPTKKLGIQARPADGDAIAPGAGEMPSGPGYFCHPLKGAGSPWPQPQSRRLVGYFSDRASGND
jgi:hypothetical protein